MDDVISTERLDLIPMTPEFLKRTILGIRQQSDSILDLKIPSAWFECADFAALRLRQFEEGLTSQPWLPRAIGLRATGEMVGYIGCHTPPRLDYMASTCLSGVEFGYEIFQEYRRRRFAWEASHALIHWAQTAHGVKRFIVSVSPSNTASQSMILKMGFLRIGSHIDAEDGPEDIFELVTVVKDRSTRP